MKDNGNCLIVGLREVSAGDSETHLKVLEDVLNDVSEMFDPCGFENDLNEGGNTNKKIIKMIKNVMSDRWAVQKRLNNLFSCYRKEILPSIVQEWQNLSEDEKEKMANVNEFLWFTISCFSFLIRQKLTAKFGIIFVWGIQKLINLSIVVTEKENLGFIV